MQDLNWLEKISIVCAKGGEALKWDTPEPWFHAELFGVFNREAPLSGWKPFDFEVPYRTFYPVQQTKGDAWKTTGAEKWVDLCLHSAASNEWYWFEFKVRHWRELDTQQFAVSAQLAFCKDVVALIGFYRESTAKIWNDYDGHTTAYKSRLTPYAADLARGKHHFVTAFVQLRLGQSSIRLDPGLWDEQPLSAAIGRTLADEGKASGYTCARPNFVLDKLERDGYSIVVCQWAASNATDTAAHLISE